MYTEAKAISSPSFSIDPSVFLLSDLSGEIKAVALRHYNVEGTLINFRGPWFFVPSPGALMSSRGDTIYLKRRGEWSVMWNN